MRILLIILLTLNICRTFASIFPDNDEESWHRRIDEKIDKNRKSDVLLRMKIDPTKISSTSDLKKLRIRVNQTRASFPLGVALDGSKIAPCWDNGFDDKYCAFARENFNFGVTGNDMKWRWYENVYGDYKTEIPDKTIEWAQSYGWGFRGHCVFWDVDDFTHFPDWVYHLGPTEMTEAVFHRLETAMTHFKGKVLHWDINNEMLHGNFFTEKTGDNDIRVKMFQKAKELDPDSLRFVNDYNVLIYDSDAYVNQIRDLLNRGAPVNGVGVQGHMGPNLIDLAKVEDSLNKFWSNFKFPIWITEFDWNGDTDGSHVQHAEELTNFYKLAMSHEGVDGIIMWGFWDQEHWRPNAAIVNGDNLTPNAAGVAYMKLFQETFRTNLEIEPELSEDDTELIYRFRGFRGQYKISTINEDHGKILNEHFEVERDIEFVIQMN